MKIRDFLDPVIIIGTLISVFIATVLYITEIDPIASFSFGLLGIAVSLLIDLTARVTSLEIRTLKTLNLSQKLLKDRWFFNRLVNLIAAWEKLNNENYPSLFTELAHLHFQNIHDELIEIASGSMTADATDFRMLTILVSEAQKTLKGTSIVTADFWEQNPVGQNYWRLNVEALGRGVKITRIFIIKEITPKFKALMKKMLDKGVRIYYILENEVPPELCVDFVVSDENLVVKSELTPELIPRRHCISSKREDVLEASSNFDRLMWLSTEYHDAT